MWLLLNSGFPSVTDAQETHKLGKVIESVLWFPGTPNSETKESFILFSHESHSEGGIPFSRHRGKYEL